MPSHSDTVSQVKEIRFLSVVVPAFNEVQAITSVLDELRFVLSQASLEAYEIIVVDDGSRDGTASAVEKFEDIRLVKHPENRGYGASLKTGILHAKYETICITDADKTYPNERIPDLIQKMRESGAAMVVGARTGTSVQIPLLRRPVKRAINYLANFAASRSIPDVNSGLRIFNRKICLLFLGILPDGFSFTTTITLAMLLNAFEVHYLPIDYHGRVGQSKIRPIQDTLNFILLIFRVALYFSPLKIFLPCAGLLLSLALCWALFSHLVLGQLADVSTLVLTMAAMQCAMIGMLAEVILRRLSFLGHLERATNLQRQDQDLPS